MNLELAQLIKTEPVDGAEKALKSYEAVDVSKCKGILPVKDQASLLAHGSRNIQESGSIAPLEVIAEKVVNPFDLLGPFDFLLQITVGMVPLVCSVRDELVVDTVIFRA